MRYALQVQYIGKNYAGSQIQFEKGIEIQTPTIQGELEKAISTLIFGDTENKNRQVKTVFSVHFDVDKSIVASKFVYQLNEILPKDISVSNLSEKDNKFHAQKSAKCRHYRFVFVNRKCKNAFDGDLMRVKFPIDIERMQKALNYIKGEHDFTSFKSSGTLNPSKICFIEEAVCQKDGDRVVIDIIGNRFLYNMVRTIVGTLLEIEGHNMPAEHIMQVLNACDRSKAGQTVSPYGLTLMKVEY